MTTQYISLKSESSSAPEIKRAAQALAEGALVVFPTETVYGIAANAANTESIERLCALKDRQPTQPFTVHIARADDCENYVPEIGQMGRRFIRKGWPGPLTLIFPVSDPSTAKVYRRLCDAGAERIYVDRSVGLRYPDHGVTRLLLQSASVPIIATSANISGAEAPVEAESIRESLGEKVDIILDGGPTRYRKNSTIVELNGEGYKVIRAGVWDERTIRRLSTINILFVCTGNTCRSPIAEGICKQMVAENLGCEIEALSQHGIIVHSAGTAGWSGGRASQEAIEVCRQRGIDISRHSPRCLSAELIHPADYIFAMAQHHIDTIRALLPGEEKKACLLNCGEDIADPIGGSLADYEQVAQIINRTLKERISEVTL